jgi:hypothetical protein
MSLARPLILVLLVLVISAIPQALLSGSKLWKGRRRERFLYLALFVSVYILPRAARSILFSSLGTLSLPSQLRSAPVLVYDYGYSGKGQRRRRH